MNCIVSGATGFVGSFLLNSLVCKGYNVAIFVRTGSNLDRIKDVLDKVKIIEVDYLNVEEKEDEIIAFNPSAFFHLGWFGVENSQHNSDDIVSVNVQSTLSLINVLQKTNISTFIGLGSQAEYGIYNSVINECFVPNPKTLYGIAKLTACNLFQFYCKKSKVRFAWLRLFSSYGPNDNPNWLIQYLIRTIHNGDSPSLTKAEQIWDYIYIDDVVSAIIASAENERVAGIYNLGSGVGYSLKDVIEKIRDKVNKNVRLGFGEVQYKEDQIMVLHADVTRLRVDANWTPKVDINEGLDRTIAWFKSTKR